METYIRSPTTEDAEVIQVSHKEEELRQIKAEKKDRTAIRDTLQGRTFSINPGDLTKENVNDGSGKALQNAINVDQSLEKGHKQMVFKKKMS